MKRFNPDKELSKIRNGNKNKIILGLCTLLLIVVVSYSFALYQVRHTQKLVFNTVGEFKKRDIYLSVLVDGETKTEFPGKEDGYVFERLDCDKEGTSATFDKDTWELVLRTNKPNKCTVVFGKKPNEPELFQGLIPVTIDDDGTIKVADTDSEWYNYGDHRWANAVLVTTEKYNELTQDNQLRKDKAGTLLSLDTDILQMYVWIPRYKYQLFNVNNETVPEQMINIVFENGIETTGNVTCKYTKGENGIIMEDCKNGEKKANNGDWYTHPAFTFKGTLEESGTELTGIWVGKFESSGAYNSSEKSVTNLKIIPNVSSLRSLQVAYMFQGVRDIEEKYSTTYNINPLEIDNHIMKNIEWGAAAYLTQSKYGRFNSNSNEIESGAEVWMNSSYTTGCAGSSVSVDPTTTCADAFSWTQGGVHASTTNNITGIYDMSGGAWEYVMANMVNTDGAFYSSDAGFNESSSIIPDAKYYDMYAYGASSDIIRGHLGDATRETRGWYSDYTVFLNSKAFWIIRGGHVNDRSRTGVWSTYGESGRALGYGSFRIVFTTQDGVK